MEPIAPLRAEALARAHHHAHDATRIRGPRLPMPRNHLKDRLLVLLRIRKTLAAKTMTASAATASNKGACC